MTRLLLTMLAMILGTQLGRADIPPVGGPRPSLSVNPLPKAVQVRVEISNTSETTRLLIPRKLLANLQNTGLTVPNRGGFASLRNLAMGLSLAACAGFGGIYLVRKPRWKNSVAVGTIALVTLGILGMATATPPSVFPPPPAPLPTQRIPPYSISGPMSVEIVDQGDTVRVLLHKDTPLLRVPNLPPAR